MEKNIHTVILNCAQYEPLVHTSKLLLEKYTREIIRTFAKIGENFKSENIIVGASKADKDTIELLEDVVSDYPSVLLKIYDGAYPAGDEYVLTYELTGQVISANSSPIEEGIAVFNVESVYNMYLELEKGIPKTHKWVSVLGEVEKPVTLRVPLGTKAGDVVKEAGNITCENPVYLIGGPMSGKPGSKLTRIDNTTDAIIILPEDHQVIYSKKTNSSTELKRAISSCCNCMRCTELCPRNLLGHPVDPQGFIRAASYKDMGNVDKFLNTMFCSSCGLCEMYSCIQGLSPKLLMTEYKKGLKENGITEHHAPLNEVNDDRKYRKISIKRLTSRLALTRYDKLTLLKEMNWPDTNVKISLIENKECPAKAIVCLNDLVTEGQIIAIFEDADKFPLYATISGIVTEVTEQYIFIENRGGRTDNE